MESQDFGAFDNIVTTLRKRVWRDRVVGALFVLGVVINFAALDVAVTAALGPSTSAGVYADENAGNPDGGLFVAHHDTAHQGVAAAQ